MTRVQKYRNTPKGYLTNIYHKQVRRNEDRGHGPLPYTLKEFQEYGLNSDEYLRLFNEYLASGREKKLAPSFDRLDNNRGYSFDNMQVVTWEVNDAKDRKSHRAIRVEQWNKERTELIKIYSSAAEAQLFSGAHRSKICEVCKGTRKSAGGYWWKYN